MSCVLHYISSIRTTDVWVVLQSYTILKAMVTVKKEQYVVHKTLVELKTTKITTYVIRREILIKLYMAKTSPGGTRPKSPSHFHPTVPFPSLSVYSSAASGDYTIRTIKATKAITLPTLPPAATSLVDAPTATVSELLPSDCCEELLPPASWEALLPSLPLALALAPPADLVLEPAVALLPPLRVPATQRLRVCWSMKLGELPLGVRVRL